MTSKIKSNTPAESTLQDDRFYIRPSMDADKPMESYFKLQGLEVCLHLHPDCTIAVYKVGPRSKLGKKPIAVGSIKANAVTTDKAPQAIGTLRTAADSLFALSLWEHEGEEGPYYVARIETRQLRKGGFVRPQQAA